MTAKGERRRAAIAAAAGEVVLAEGPAGLSHRAVAARAGVPLAATTYYFRDLDDLSAAAGVALVEWWTGHARRVLDAWQPGGDPAAVLAEALLPPGDDAAIRAHHEHLLALARNPALAAAVGAAREQLDSVLATLTATVLGAAIDPALVLAVADGAVIAAASEARPIRPHTERLLASLLSGYQHEIGGS